MIRFLTILLASALVSQAAYVTVDVTFTNVPATGDAFVRNGSTGIWTNGPVNNVSWIQTNGITGSATNLMRWIIGNANAYNTKLTSATNVRVSGIDLAFSITGTYAFLTTNSAPTTNFHALLIPWDTQPYSTNRTNDANELIYGLNKYTSSNLFSEGSIPLGNYVSLIATQTVKNKILTNSTIVGGSISNTILTNIARANIGQATLTNAVIQSGTVSNVVLTNVTLIGSSFGIGTTNTVAAGTLRFVDSALIGGENMGTTNTRWNFLDIGQNTNTVARLSDATNVAVYYINLLDASKIDNLAGTATGFTGTDTTLDGSTTYANTNIWTGDLSVTPRVYSGLGNGDNYNIPFGTNAAIYASGATTVMKMHSLPAGRSYQRLRVRLSGAVTNWIVNESLGEGTVTERITTATGGDIFSTNQPGWLELEYTGSRWEVVSFR